jgi:hypothetical protein
MSRSCSKKHHTRKLHAPAAFALFENAQAHGKKQKRLADLVINDASRAHKKLPKKVRDGLNEKVKSVPPPSP